jgi:hypothetical protein
VSLERQGEADPVIDLMNEFAPSSILKRGTKTWQGGGQGGDSGSTIDLVLTSETLTGSMVKCAIHVPWDRARLRPPRNSDRV